MEEYFPFLVCLFLWILNRFFQLTTTLKQRNKFAF
jgi:hypothetical protein